MSMGLIEKVWRISFSPTPTRYGVHSLSNKRLEYLSRDSMYKRRRHAEGFEQRNRRAKNKFQESRQSLALILTTTPQKNSL